MITLGEYRATPGGEDGKLRVLCEAPELVPHVHKPWFRAYLSEWTDVPLSPELGRRGQTPHGRGGAGLAGPPRLPVWFHRQRQDTPRAAPVRRTTAGRLLGGDAGPEGGNHPAPLADRSRRGPAPGAGDGALAAPLRRGSAGLEPAGQQSLRCPARAGGKRRGGGAGKEHLLLGAEAARPADQRALADWAHTGFPCGSWPASSKTRSTGRGCCRMPLPCGEQGLGDPVALQEAREYFCQEFAAWSKSERASAVAPVLNKFRELLRSPFLRSLLCARRTTLNLAGLWQQPGLVLVHLDSVSLGEEGVRLLGGLMAHQLLRTALRVEGPVPVVLALDEMGISEQFVGTAASHILAIARSRGLRLLVACQHLAQLSEGLRAALLANTAVQAFFRLGPADAKVVAAALAAGAGEQVARVAVDVAKRDADGFPASFAQMNHTITDGFGSPVALSAAAWTAFRHLAKSAGGEGQVAGLKRLAGVSGVERLYVTAPGTKQPVELGRYVRGLGVESYHVAGPSPVRLVVTFPKPKLSVVARLSEGERQQRWQKVLMELPVRQAVLRLASGKPGVVRVAEVTDPASVPGFEKFVSAAVAGSGQSAKEIEEVLAWRREGVERVAAGSQMPLTTSANEQGVLIPSKDQNDLPRSTVMADLAMEEMERMARGLL